MPIKKEPPLTNRQKASEGEEKKWIGYGLPQHTLPAGHLTIECRMVEQKKPPATGALLAAGGKNRLSKKHTLR
jgi:hypothetical protein